MLSLREGLETAILNRKAKPNRLLVEDAVNDDNSVVALSLAKVGHFSLSKDRVHYLPISKVYAW